MNKQVHVWHLEITDADKAARSDDHCRYELLRTDKALPELNRMLYVAVGAPWHWYERLSWSYREWQDFLGRDTVQTWIAYLGASPVGYFELEVQAAGSTEICYFGLLPEFIGQGLGGPLLKDAIHKAWQAGGKRVWLHTCSLDHPQALPNYLARGFRIFKEEDIRVNLPDEPIEPWPGAYKPTLQMEA